MLLVTLACLSGVCVSAHNIPHRRWDEREECQWKLTPGSVPLVPVPSATVCDRVVGKATHCVGASIKWGVQIWTKERREGISAKSHPWSCCLWGSLQVGTACLLCQCTLVVSFRFGSRGKTVLFNWSESGARKKQVAAKVSWRGEAGTGDERDRQTHGLDSLWGPGGVRPSVGPLLVCHNANTTEAHDKTCTFCPQYVRDGATRGDDGIVGFVRATGAFVAGPLPIAQAGSGTVACLLKRC